MKDIVLFGIQGSGKWTQAQLLVQALPDAFSYFSSGDVFRALTSTDNAIGNYLNDRLKNGQLIDDRVTNALFELYMHSVIDDGKAMLLDGYPRSVKQLEMMLHVCKEHNRDMVAVYFTLPEEEAKARMKSRGRSDDTDVSIEKRIKQYYDITMPMLEVWKSLYPVIEIDAQPSIEAVHAEVMKRLWS